MNKETQKFLDSVADRFNTELEAIQYLKTQCLDDIVNVAMVAQKQFPDFDINEFYDRAGYTYATSLS